MRARREPPARGDPDMMLVKTRLLKSPIEGYGLFADEDIKKGTQTWKVVDGLDFLLEPAFVEGLASPMKEFCLRYCYLSPRNRKYVLCGDDARFMNHAEDANTMGIYPEGEIEGVDVATRDIKKGEELTCDYRTFDQDFELKMTFDRT
jgi:SET domain-containing protein